MPYTQSQLRCLHGMGIVPWVERSVAQADAATTLRDAIVAVEKEDQRAVHTAKPITAAGMAETATTTNSVTVNNNNADDVGVSNQIEQGEQIGLTDSLSNGNAHDFMQTPLVEIPFRGQRCTQLGKSDAPLLILVEACSTQQNQYPFEAADAKIFEDMLRAIAWRRQDVCLGVLPPTSAPSLFVDSSAPSVSDLCQPHRDAVLLFRQSVPETGNTDKLIVPLARAGMLAWQLPHPALLRESPQRKRQAWNVLKAARARLG